MKFPYQQHPREPSEAFPNLKSRLVSIVPVTIKHNDKAIAIDALVDSGADSCVFPGMLGVALGIDVGRGPKQNIAGLGQRIIEVRFHHVRLKVGSAEVKVYAGFTFDTIGISGLLGQRGFFDQFRIVFDRADNCVIINQRSFSQKILTRLGW